MHADITLDGGLHYLKLPVLGRGTSSAGASKAIDLEAQSAALHPLPSAGTNLISPDQIQYIAHIDVPVAVPAPVQQKSSTANYLHSADTLDPKAASKRKKLVHSTSPRDLLATSIKTAPADRGSSSSLPSSSDSDDSSSSDSDSGRERQDSFRTPHSMYSFQNTIPRHSVAAASDGLVVRPVSFSSEREVGFESVAPPVIIPAGRFRSASSLPASSIVSGSVSEWEAEGSTAAPSAVVSGGVQVTREMDVTDNNGMYACTSQIQK